MFLERFHPDPFDASSWTYDNEHGGLTLNNKALIVVVKGRVEIPALLLDRDRLEQLAEALLFRAAASNEPVPIDDLEAHFARQPYGLTIAVMMHVKGVEVALPSPQFVGNYNSNSAGGANLFLSNRKAVVPVLRRPTIH